MVKLNIIVEGGVSFRDVSADTVCNVESLRQSLHQFFSRLMGSDDVSIVVHMGWGYRAAAKQYVSGDASDCLYVDSDVPMDFLSEWFEKLLDDECPEKSIVIPEERRERVFFMIQEMEAWMLKQPECLERWACAEGYIRKRREEAIEEHSLIRNKDIESIAKPSEKLAILLRTFFEVERDGKRKPVRYGKLKSAPGILDAIDAGALITMDSELQRFLSVVAC